MAAPSLPIRFPCWCRAVYSWGGETDKDLGFIEGDLIECLNAGDGSWWMGRLRRDRRMMGYFPSNFVEVLSEGFTPVSRSTSPMPTKSTDESRQAAENYEKKKEQTKRRKPFQGYKTSTAPGNPAANSISRTASPAAPRQALRNDPANPPSTVLWQQKPASRGISRSPSPLPHHEIGSSPPPPPPPHRVGLNDGDINRSNSPVPEAFDMNDRYRTFGRTPSPAPPSMNGHTPPMIRDAMDGVLSSLDDMGLSQQQSARDEEEHFNPWSPEAFGNFRQPHSIPRTRPLTSLGFGYEGSTYSEEAREKYSDRHNSPDRYFDGPPHLETYVQRMERQLEERARQREEGEGMGSVPPEPPPKNSPWATSAAAAIGRKMSLRKRRSAYDGLDRTYTTKTSSTNSSSGVQSVATTVSNQSSRTSQSIFSGYSAGGFSATSAGSLARKRNIHTQQPSRPLTSAGVRGEHREWEPRPMTPDTEISRPSNRDSRGGARSAVGWEERSDMTGGLGGFSTPKPKKAGFLQKLNESMRTSFASARSTIVPNGSESQSGSPSRSNFNNGVTGIAGGLALSPPKADRTKSATSAGHYGRDAAREMGLVGGAATSWVMTRRDLHRSNTPGPSERKERVERTQMMNEPVIYPAEELYETIQGDEDADGRPVYQAFKLSNPSFSQVDKAARFITSLPSSITAASLATGYLCRPYRSDVQRLRAIFIWCAERVSWEDEIGFDDLHGGRSPVDTRRVIQSKRGTSREIAALVMEMCYSIGVPAEMIQGYLKRPGTELDLEAANSSTANHWWNAVLVDGEWRLMDASLASPTHPQRSCFTSVSPTIAEAWYFLSKPSEICWTHVPVEAQHQHMVPAVSPDTLLALPAACPPFFRLGLMVHAYDTSLIRLEELEMCTVAVNVPVDVEIVAEIETKAYHRDQDGDLYDDPDSCTKKRTLAQPVWYRTNLAPEVLQKRYLIKAVLPGDEDVGALKIYAGKKGLMHSAKDIIHPLAMAVPVYHAGKNPPYDFVKRYPTPHATRQDLYVVQPQCWNLGSGETYVFCVRQHSANVAGTPGVEKSGFDLNRPVSPNPLMRPASAMSMSSSTAGGSQQGSESGSSLVTTGVKVKDKPAKLAIQSPGGRIIRMNRKSEGLPQPAAAREQDGEIVGSVWEAVVKVSEKGTWRGLVLADRSARWCVWGEWECC